MIILNTLKNILKDSKTIKKYDLNVFIKNKDEVSSNIKEILNYLMKKRYSTSFTVHLIDEIDRKRLSSCVKGLDEVIFDQDYEFINFTIVFDENFAIECSCCFEWEMHDDEKLIFEMDYIAINDYIELSDVIKYIEIMNKMFDV
jgi:hypothetical protein